MNIRIEKCSSDDEQALTFLAKERLNMHLELNPKYRSIYEGEMKDILIDNFIEKYRKSEFDKISTIYIALLDDEIVGAIQLDKGNYLSGLFVNEKYQRNGIGTRLLERLITECNDLDIIRVDARITAISLYERFSFHRVMGEEYTSFVPMELERRHYGK